MLKVQVFRIVKISISSLTHLFFFIIVIWKALDLLTSFLTHSSDTGSDYWCSWTLTAPQMTFSGLRARPSSLDNRDFITNAFGDRSTGFPAQSISESPSHKAFPDWFLWVTFCLVFSWFLLETSIRVFTVLPLPLFMNLTSISMIYNFLNGMFNCRQKIFSMLILLV